MKKRFIIIGILVLALLISLPLLFINIRHQDFRKKCENVGLRCYLNNVESTLNEDRSVNLDFVQRTQDICNECTEACLQVFGLEKGK